MGDETTQFASRFSAAVKLLAEIAGEGGAAGAPGPRDLRAAVGGALDAVEAVYATETSAVRDWPEQRKRVLARIAAARAALKASRVGDELRAEARALVRLVDPGSARSPEARRRR